MLERLRTLQTEKKKFSKNNELLENIKQDSELRRGIETLSKHFLNQEVVGCSNCYADAYIQLMNLNIEKMEEKERCEFKLYRGVLLRDVANQDVALNCTQANITTELALYHLKTNPSCVKLFEKVPDNWKELIEDTDISEDDIIEEIAQSLRLGSVKTAIKDNYKGIKKVGGKNLTDKYLTELIKRAEDSIEYEKKA